MPQGHHGANHPVKDFTTGKVEIVSMNHGFAVDRDTLPANVKETHVSLFDGSNCGVALTDRPAFSVQYHPEASPGPRDSHYLFRRFVDLMETAKEGRGWPDGPCSLDAAQRFHRVRIKNCPLSRAGKRGKNLPLRTRRSTKTWGEPGPCFRRQATGIFGITAMGYRTRSWGSEASSALPVSGANSMFARGCGRRSPGT